MVPGRWKKERHFDEFCIEQCQFLMHFFGVMLLLSSCRIEFEIYMSADNIFISSANRSKLFLIINVIHQN